MLEFDVDTSLATAANGWGHRMIRAARKGMDDLGLKALLVRPDGVVSWASESVSDVDVFSKAATTWFGEP
ncbi:hypothetical protein [Andreprevotia sp. IGB-42]|uniref:aromatic-ring hydroxylase C-terminal domain-containing protein n=1 Tax=Andreprevotia sp. IGB-42 TaxID=2497473 RepID=UPI0035B54CD2